MKKIITEFNEVGICKIDVTQTIKMWKDRFYILKWHDEYTLVVPFRKGFKTPRISNEQAQEIIDNLGLIEVRSTLLVNSSSFRTKNYILSELDRYKGIAYEKELDLEFINNEIFNFNKSLLNN